MCNEEILNLISGHIDGCNTPQEEALLQQHLLDCADCRQLLAAYEAIDHEVADLDAAVPDTLHANVMRAVHALPRTQTKPRTQSNFMRIAAAAAVVAVVLLAAGTGHLWDPARGTASVTDAIIASPATKAAVQSDLLRSKEAAACRQVLIYGADAADFPVLQPLQPQLLEDGTLCYQLPVSQLQILLDACAGTYLIEELVEDYTDDTTAYVLLTDRTAP